MQFIWRTFNFNNELYSRPGNFQYKFSKIKLFFLFFTRKTYLHIYCKTVDVDITLHTEKEIKKTKLKLN